MSEHRITESQLVLPTLYLLSQNLEEGLTTGQLIPLLTAMFRPTGTDADILENRNDTYFSQKVRNLKSHDTLTDLGYATYTDGRYHITPAGLHYLDSTIKDLLCRYNPS